MISHKHLELLRSNIQKCEENLRRLEAKWEEQARLFGVESDAANYYLRHVAQTKARLVNHCQRLTKAIAQ